LFGCAAVAYPVLWNVDGPLAIGDCLQIGRWAEELVENAPVPP
jgi:hypothetical protein